MRLILASASPRRRALLDRLGVSFTVAAAALDETVAPDERPEAYVSRLAAEKAAAVAASLPAATGETFVIGADTSVILDGRVLGKPADAAEARAMLGALRGRVHQVLTGVAVQGTLVPLRPVVCTTHVTMRSYGDAEVERYIASGDPFDKAGGYAIQHAAFSPVASLAGCYANVVGLPLCRLGSLLSQAGVRLGPGAAEFATLADQVCAFCRPRQVAPRE